MIYKKSKLKNEIYFHYTPLIHRLVCVLCGNMLDWEISETREGRSYCCNKEYTFQPESYKMILNQ